MRINWTHMAMTLGLFALVASPASAALVAGWGFSNQSGDGASLAVASSADVLGTATSAQVTSAGGTAASLPPGTNRGDFAGLQGGINGAQSDPDPTFAPGQAGFAGGLPLGMTTSTSTTAVFDSTLAAPNAGTYRLTFGGRAIVDAASPGTERTNVAVAFGPCGSETSIGNVDLFAEDTTVNMYLGTSATTNPCVVLTLDGSSVQPLIDNVSLSTVPEPGFGVLVMAGAAGVAALGRRGRR